MCGCIHDEAKTLIATIDSRQHADATRKCVRWSSSAARGWGMPTNAGAAHSAHGGDRHRYIVGAAPRTTVCVRTSCFADNRPHAALFLAPAWACNHRHLRLSLHVPLDPAVPEPATHEAPKNASTTSDGITILARDRDTYIGPAAALRPPHAHVCQGYHGDGQTCEARCVDACTRMHAANGSPYRCLVE